MKRILHDPPDVYVHARVRACKCMQAVPNPDQSNPSAGRLSAMVTLFLAGLHRRFLPHSTRARRWHLRKQFFLSWPECHICPDFLYLLFLFAFASPPLSPPDSCRVPPFAILAFSALLFLSFFLPFFSLFFFPPLSTFFISFHHFLHHFHHFASSSSYISR